MVEEEMLPTVASNMSSTGSPMLHDKEILHAVVPLFYLLNSNSNGTMLIVHQIYMGVVLFFNGQQLIYFK